VTLVEYGDIQSPYCGAELIRDPSGCRRALGRKLRFVFRNFPLTHAHPYALLAAQAAEAAALQGKFWEMHDVIFENQEQLQPEVLPAWAHKIGLDVNQFAKAVSEGKVTKRIEEDYASGQRAVSMARPAISLTDFVTRARTITIHCALPSSMRKAGLSDAKSKCENCHWF
jgi:protein-disulfide isomerase